MIVSEQVTDKLQNLPVTAQEEVLDFVEFLLQKNEGRKHNGQNGTAVQKAESIERWAKSHRSETPVILDDRREIIYED